MKNKKNILLLLLLFVVAMSMLTALNLDDTYYKRYKTTVIDSSQVEGAGLSPYGDNGVSLPIIGTYNPNVDEDFVVTSSTNESVGLYYDVNPITYNTEFYDITSVGRSEEFTLSYINNIGRTQFRSVHILFDKEFYSTDGQKHTGISIDLDYDNVINDRKISLRNATSGESTFWVNGNNNESLNYNNFDFKIKKGYHNSDLIKFHFTWTPTSIEDINEYSSDYNNRTFASGEKVLSFVLIQVYAN